MSIRTGAAPNLDSDPNVISEWMPQGPRKAVGTGERRLAATVLASGCSDWIKYRGADRDTDRLGWLIAMEAREWLISRDRRWPYSFENLCDALGLDPDYIREGLEL